MQGARVRVLRPLTLHTPKPIVPIFNRAFLHYQIDLLKQVPEIDEVILSLNYQPRRIEEMFGDGENLGIKIRYVVEPAPLGTAGAIKYAGDKLTESVVVFNGDVMTELDLAEVIRMHRERRARATIVLTPVENPSAYGLVETDGNGNIQRFLEKPKPEEVTTNHINAGIYVLEPDTFDRIPSEIPWSIERSYFPSLIERGETFVAYIYNGYWIDIGTPEKYMQVHRDIMDGRFTAPPFAGLAAPRTCDRSGRADRGVAQRSRGRCSSTRVSSSRPGARVGPYAVLGRQTQVEEEAVIERAILWPNCRIGSQASISDATLGRQCHVGRNVSLNSGAVLGDKTTLTDFTKA